MAQRDRYCPECGQIFASCPTNCPGCGRKFHAIVDKGRLSDLIPGFRRLPYSVRKAMMVVVLFCIVAYLVDLPEQLDKLHVFMNRRGLPSWMKK